MMPLVEMRQIVKTFGPVMAVRGADFSVNHGEVVGLVGDNGAGKSTLMKVLTGVHQPDGGELNDPAARDLRMFAPHGA